MLAGACGHRFLYEADLTETADDGYYGVERRRVATFASPLRADLRERTRQRLLALGATSTLTGGARGADLDVTWLGATVLDLPSTVLAPKPTWRRDWPPEVVASSDELFAHRRVAVEFALPAEHVLDGREAARFRNGALVRRLRAAGGRLLAWWDGRPSGTSHAVRLAEAAGVPVEILEPRPEVAGRLRALVVPVNLAGVFGAGLAVRVAERWPAVVGAYARHRRHRLTEAPLPWRTSDGRWLLLVPTKYRPDDPRSNLDLIHAALRLLPEVYGGRDPVVCPALGCGLGGLEWAEIYPLLVDSLSAITSDLSLQWPLPKFAR